MSDVFIGQIMLTGFSFAPRNFAACNGQVLPIAQNQALFALLGTIYGGNGTTNFQLPDLRGRTPLGFGKNALGTAAGAEAVSLTVNQLPMHAHGAQANTATATTGNPTDGAFAGSGAENIYAATGGTQVELNATTITMVGGGQPHENMQPFSVLNFCVALAGTFPQHN